MFDIFNFKERWTGEIDIRKRRLLSLATVTAVLVIAYLASLTLNEIKQYSFIGAGVQPTNVISVSGQGEVFSVPDIAEISFSAQIEGKSVADAQKKVTDIINPSIEFLKKSGVAEKDIKTTGYNAYPQYNYVKDGTDTTIYPPLPGKRVLSGYNVTQTITVKVRDTDKVGAIIDGLGKLKVTDLSGPNFSIDDDNAIKAEARKKAIDDAKSKAEKLANDLGVKLVRIVSFSENGNYPVYYAKSMAIGMGGAESAPAPDLPKGENKTTSSVTISYEIR